MSLLLALVLVAAGLYVAAKVVKFAVKALILGGVVAVLYLVVIPQVERLL